MLLNQKEIDYLKVNKDQITRELLDALRTSKEGKHQALEILDIERDDEEYYLDAFGNRISFRGDRLLKKQYTKLKLYPIHLDEISACLKDIRYFRDNYIQIKTPTSGVNFPDFRDYQNHIIEELQEDNEQIIILSPRQCVTGDTIIKTRNGNIRIRDLFNAGYQHHRISDGIFINSALTDTAVKCQSGFIVPLELLQTIPLKVIRLTFSNGKSLCCAPNHTLITAEGNEVRALDAYNKNILSYDGSHLCISVDDMHKQEPMFDITFPYDHLYWTNDFLSHNSGKSITIATWLSWLYCFSKDIIMGICANKRSMATEFLKNTKDIITLLPIWMTPGCKTWNIGSIAGDNNCRILTDAPSSNSFRGFSCNVIVVDEAAYLNPQKFEEFKDGILPSQSSLAWKKTIYISTANGINHFYNMVKGARARKHIKNITENELEQIKANHKILDLKQKGDLYDVELDEPANGHKLIEVDWKCVPRYHEDGTPKTPDEFKDEIIAKHGIVHFNQAYANCVDGDAVVTCIQKDTNDTFNITLYELYTYLKNGDWQAVNLQILTNSGYSDFVGIRRTRHKTGWAVVTQKRKFVCSDNHRFLINNTWCFASAVRIGDILDGTKVINKVRLDLRKRKGFLTLYDILNTQDHTYITSGAVSHNCFIGSSYTLISGEKLGELTGAEPIEVRDGKLNIYDYPKKKHKYIMAVDPAKDGMDGFAVTIVDITKFPFIQVAACSLNIDYFLMPDHLAYWGELYNEAFIIIENNEGAGQSIADMLKQDYEYGNLYYNKRSGKKYPGFRTTPRTRKLILNTMKMFIENGNLLIKDYKTINEFYTFILVNGKYQADENCHDDRVMSLALIFAPFCEVKNFQEAKEMIQTFYSKDSHMEFTEFLTIGYFDV